MKKYFFIGVVTLSLFVGGVFFMKEREDLGVYAWEKFRLAGVAGVLNSSSAGLHFSLGNYYFGGEGYDIRRAEESFLKATSLNDTLPRLHYQLARLYFIEGNFFEAVKHANRELELYSEYKRTFYIRGLAYGYNGNFDKAEYDFKAFLNWKPDSWAGHNDLVWVYFMKGDFKNAEKYSREGLEYFPDNPWLNNSLGVALLNLGKYEDAKFHLEKALIEFGKMEPGHWGVAYPGNDPDIYGEGYESTKSTIESNIKIAESKMKGE